MLEAKELKHQLSNVRAQLQLSQRELARLARVSPMVVSNAENGYSIRRLSAYAILNAINELRKDRGQTPLEIDDVEWVIGK